eukprot:4692748-Prymnesium_polylepis.2
MFERQEMILQHRRVAVDVFDRQAEHGERLDPAFAIGGEIGQLVRGTRRAGRRRRRATTPLHLIPGGERL